MHAWRLKTIVVALLAALLGACGQSHDTGPPPPPATFTVGVTVSGLTGGGLSLRNNGGDNLLIAANGSATFATSVASGGSYAVTVATQPTAPAQICTVANGTGTATANVTNVAITCVTSFTVGGTVTGLAGSGLALLNNGADNLSVTSTGAFTFATRVANAGAYSISVATQPTNVSQTCTVANASGTVPNANVTNVAITCTTNTYTVGGTVSGLAGTGLVLQNNTGNDLNISANGSFTFTTAIPSGGSYDVIVLARPANPAQICTVTNGAGSVTSAAITSVTIVCTTQYPRTADTFDYYGGTMSGYYVDATTGQLRRGQTYKVGQAPIEIIGDKAGKFFYVLNTGRALSPSGLPALPATSSSISAFKVDAAGINGADFDGTEVTGSPFATSSGQPAANWISMHPSDKFMYVTNQTLNNIDAFAIDSNTGALTAVPGGPIATGTAPDALSFDAAGQFGYVANRDSADIFVYSINAATGALTVIPANRVQTGPKPAVLSFSPNKKFIYVVNQDSGTVPGSISGYSVNSSTGALAAVSSSPFAVGINPGGIVYHPNGKVLYVKNTGASGTAGSLSAFSIDPVTGLLTPLSGSPYAIGVNAGGSIALQIDPAGKYLYVANEGTGGSTGSISAFSIDTNGALIPITGIATLTPAPFSITIDPSGKFLYQVNVGSDQVYSYSIDASTGALNRLVQGGISRSGSEPIYIGVFASRTVSTPLTFTPRFAYVPNASDNTISTYASDATTGALSVVGSATATAVAPQAVAVSLRKKYAVVASAGSSPTTAPGTLSSYSINQTTGALTAGAGSAPTGIAPASVTTDGSGRFVYVANTLSNSISAYTLSDATGALTANGSTSMTSPIAVAVDPTSRNLYALSPTQIAVYAIDSATGTLGAPVFGTSTTTLPAAGATQVTVDPNGNFLYVSIPSVGVIMIYPIYPYSGTFTNIAPFGPAVQFSSGRANTALAIDPTGRFAYTADSTDKTVSAYSINQTTGVLTLIGAPLTVAANANSVSTDISGKFVYVVLANNTVATYSIGNTGALTLVSGGSVATGNSPGPITAVGSIQ